MTREQLKRIKVLDRLKEKSITVQEAAQLLDLSDRQVLRMKAQYLREGESAVVHKNKGRKPIHALSDELRQHILTLYQSERYKNCNDHHFAELLVEYENIHVSPATIRRIRREASLPPARRRRSPKTHRSRARKPRRGMLVQMDASPHAWLEDRSEPFALLAAIDDATGEVIGAVFRPTEDLVGYFTVVKQIVEQHGVPVAIYTDRHTIFQSPKEKHTLEQELAGEQPALSQFGKALSELGITHIKALTPQAKGRIERLWETLQDRWVKELRIRGICTLDEANAVLPDLVAKHNGKFKVEPQETESDFTPFVSDLELNQILCYRVKRLICSGQTISYKGKKYVVHSQNKKRPQIPAKTSVEVRETVDGQLFLQYLGQVLPLKELEIRKENSVTKENTTAKEKASVAQHRKPAADHPWRKPWIPKRASKIP